MNALPGHVAIIMDGTAVGPRPAVCRAAKATAAAPRRYAEPYAPHASSGCLCLTLYAFSAQNWDRPAVEVSQLMQLLRTFLIAERDEVAARGIRLVTIGDETRLPDLVRAPLAPSSDTRATTTA